MTDKASPPDPRGRVLVIAGSDSGGGAGIQADIKAITAMGGFAMTAVTAITVQDTTAVHSVWPVPVEAVTGQIAVTLSDLGADSIKTGMLGERALVEAIAETLDAGATGIPRVIDPVMVSSRGDRLLPESAIDTIRALLIPQAQLVTPNAWEAQILTGNPVETVDDQRRAAEQLLEAGARGALVKGAHVAGDVIVDVLQTPDGEWLFEGPRIATQSTHGTGCTLASSTAALIAQGRTVPDAAGAARDYLVEAISRSPGFGAGHGAVDHAWPLREARHPGG
ncbi:MAG: bifunctional hydroxymethylpyrimidine kinase/phosphomethylpyrimidine kinase [Alphaproteobacteria bacterium]|jgi:hydroxymethylpyrimidine/phosphomethylpyrimidine kinase|nr:bifunctional hydroxymethylpyrimidine kinase/phosphomethylpyrimidine kinase [Alphaproteobacteria bacterium]